MLPLAFLIAKGPIDILLWVGVIVVEACQLMEPQMDHLMEVGVEEYAVGGQLGKQLAHFAIVKDPL